MENIPKKDAISYLNIGPLLTLKEGEPVKKLVPAYLTVENDKVVWESESASKNKEVHPIKKYFHDFGESWTVHGPSRIVSNKHWVRKIVWIILWLLAVSYGTYQCYKVLQEYYTYPKTVTIEIKEVDKLEFPAVTFCTLNPFSLKSDDWYQENDFWKDFYETGKYFSSDQGENSDINCTNFEGDDLRSILDEDYGGYPTVLCQEYGLEDLSKHELFLCYGTDDMDAIEALPKEKKWPKDNFQDDYNLYLKKRNEIKKMRLECSIVYQRLQNQRNVYHGEPELNKDFSVGDTSNCPNLTSYTKNFNILKDKVCGIPIFNDEYGYFTEDVRDCQIKYSPNVSAKLICSTCCEDLHCFPYDDFVQLESDENVDSKEELQMIITNSLTSDAVKLMENFNPLNDEIISSNVKKSEIIATCSFDRDSCSHRDFKEWMHKNYGKCYTFNAFDHIVTSKSGDQKAARVKYTSSYGPKNGLRLTLNIKTKHMLKILSPEIGVRMIFHKANEVPFPEEEGVNIMPGVSTSIKVSLKQLNRQTAPWGNCSVMDSGLSQTYTKTLCVKRCIEMNYRNTCGCSMGRSPAYDKIPFVKWACSVFNVTEKVCMDDVLFQYHQGTLGCNCPVSCNEWEYNSELAYSTTNKEYYKIIQNIKQKRVGDDACDEADNATVRVNVYLGKLSYEVITESPSYTFETLLSNLGGNFGLFVGMSIMSVVELLELLIDVCLYLCYEKKKIKPDSNASENSNKKIPVFLLVE